MVGVLRSFGQEASAAFGHWPQVIGERPLGMENIERGLTDLLNLFLGPDGHGGRRPWWHMALFAAVIVATAWLLGSFDQGPGV